GRDTTNLQHPWQVALHTRYSGHLCGASLISKRIILTAAHCVDTFGARDLRIKGQSETGEMKRLKRLPRVQEVIIHPGFDANNLASDDIAIIKLKSDVRLSDTLQPIKVIDQGFRNGLLENNFRNLPGKMMSSGWGTLEPPSRFPIHSKTLQEVDVKAVGVTKTDLVEQAFRDMLISDFNMNDEIINFIQINDSNVLLTTGEVAQTGNCMGDSGGPLVYYEQGKEPVLIGITSYAVGGEKLCLGLAGFTNIQAYGQWLKENID
ncbi:MAG: serine protease, partial [Bacteriovoracaceae bacterium]|nr:serine protease [Bacteriovoracaceae bacterium]